MVDPVNVANAASPDPLRSTAQLVAPADVVHESEMAFHGAVGVEGCGTAVSVGAAGGCSVPLGVSSTVPDCPVTEFRANEATARSSLILAPLPVIAQPAAVASGESRPPSA
jgi:hypothetical protein